MPSTLAATIFGTQCTSLKVLTLSVEVMGLLGTRIAAVAALSQLERLEVCMI